MESARHAPCESFGISTARSLRNLGISAGLRGRYSLVSTRPNCASRRGPGIRPPRLCAYLGRGRGFFDHCARLQGAQPRARGAGVGRWQFAQSDSEDPVATFWDGDVFRLAQHETLNVFPRAMDSSSAWPSALAAAQGRAAAQGQKKRGRHHEGNQHDPSSAVSADDGRNGK